LDLFPLSSSAFTNPAAGNSIKDFVTIVIVAIVAIAVSSYQ